MIDYSPMVLIRSPLQVQFGEEHQRLDKILVNYDS